MTENVKSRVKKHEGVDEALDKIEEEYGVTILSARDFGSTSWNLDSESSDRDVAFVYIHPMENYVQLGKTKENIDRDFEFNGKEHTFMGWNIKKFMTLLDDSNPTVIIEFLNSPIIYRERNDILACMEDSSNAFAELQIHANENFKPISLFYHYRSMAKSNFEKYIENGNDVTVKRHLYIIRGIAYALYVKKTHEMPPLDFKEFYENEMLEMKGDEIPFWLYQYTGLFIHKKKNGRADDQLVDKELHDWMRNELEGKLDSEEHDVRGIETELLNEATENIFKS